MNGAERQLQKNKEQIGIVDGIDYQIPVTQLKKKSATYRLFIPAVYEISLTRHILIDIPLIDTRQQQCITYPE